MGLITILIAIGVRLIFLPIHYSNYLSMSKNKRLSPDLNDYQNKINRLRSTENIVLAKKMEKELMVFRKTHGITNNIVKLFLTLFQGFTMIVWAGIVHKFTNKLDEFPQMLTEGFLWFSDLTASDPYFIFPFLTSLMIFMNLTKSTQISSNYMIKTRSIMKFTPIFSLTGFCCMPMGFVLYIFTNSAFQAIFINCIQSKYMLKFTRDDEYINGSKLNLLVSFLYDIFNLINIMLIYF